MADDSNVWQAAETLIDRFGAAAADQAALRARELRGSGNAEASDFWTAVKQAATMLLRHRNDPSVH